MTQGMAYSGIPRVWLILGYPGYGLFWVTQGMAYSGTQGGGGWKGPSEAHTPGC